MTEDTKPLWPPHAKYIYRKNSDTGKWEFWEGIDMLWCRMGFMTDEHVKKQQKDKEVAVVKYDDTWCMPWEGEDD